MKRTPVARLAVGALFGFFLQASAQGEPRPAFFALGGDQLEITEGEWPKAGGERPEIDWQRTRHLATHRRAYAVLDGPGEIFVVDTEGSSGGGIGTPRAAGSYRIGIRWESEDAESLPSGTIFVPAAGTLEFAKLPFRVKAKDAGKERAQTRFLEIRSRHYGSLWASGLPGAAWFRHEFEETLSQRENIPENERTRWRPRARFQTQGDMQESLALYSGGRALSENLQLDRELVLRRENTGDFKTTPLDEIEGVTVAAYDWAPFIEGKDPARDALAPHIPHDQYAVFVPDFASLMALVDTSQTQAGDLFRLAASRPEDAGTRARYERQLCLAPDALARILGPRLVKSVAITGSDPYFRTGTDVAVLFEATAAKSLVTAIRSRQLLEAGKNGVEEVSGTTQGIDYHGVRSLDRAVCSYVAAIGETVIVTNSLIQIERVASVRDGKIEPLSKTDDFTFFRDRYPLGEEGESALAVLSDAFIRRLCGPRWRIGASRRTRAASVLSELQARNLEAVIAGEPAENLNLDGLTLPPRLEKADLQSDALGIRSTTYGSLAFLTPISELAQPDARPNEVQAYSWFRRGYQNAWTNAFDPIAAQIGIAEEELSVDLTVRPLIRATRYREMIAQTHRNDLNASSGDPHPEALVQFVMAVDASKEPISQAGAFLSGMGQRIDPYGFLGNWCTAYADADPYWDDLVKEGLSFNEMSDRSLAELPLGFGVETRNPFKLAAFLTTLRTLVETSAPGLTLWEAKEHNEIAYVEIRATSQGRRMITGDTFEGIAIRYVALPGQLLFSLNEKIIHRAIDRSQAMADQEADAGAEKEKPAPGLWGGSGAATRVSDLPKVMEAMFAQQIGVTQEARSWSAIPILNEWRRHFPDRDPGELHEANWLVSLDCPSGGEYRWNEAFHTYESSVHSHPGNPGDHPIPNLPLDDFKSSEFGITFEEDGLRAKTVLRK